MLQKVSVLVPTRNEEPNIRQCLDSLLKQDYEGEVEILVVDGMSTDRTVDVVREVAAHHPNVRLLKNPKRTVTAALNIGIPEAEGEFIARGDAHALYESDYISQCVKHINDTGAANVGGVMNQLPETTFFGSIARALHESRFGIGAAKFHRGGHTGWVDTVWPGFYRREVFDRVGLYREKLTRSEDIELNRRLHAAGFRIYMSPEIKAHYRPRNTLKGLLAQNFGNGRAISQTIFVSPGAISLRHLVPGTFVTVACIFLAMLCCPIAGISSLAWVPIALLAAAYGLAGVWFSASSAVENGNAMLLPALMVVFPLLHVTYGLGTLWGLVSEGPKAIIERVKHGCSKEPKQPYLHPTRA